MNQQEFYRIECPCIVRRLLSGLTKNRTVKKSDLFQNPKSERPDFVSPNYDAAKFWLLFENLVVQILKQSV